MAWIKAAVETMYEVDMWGKVFITQDEIIAHPKIKEIITNVQSLDQIEDAVKKLENATKDISEEVAHDKIARLVGALEGQGIKLSHDKITLDRSVSIDWDEIVRRDHPELTPSEETPAK